MKTDNRAGESLVSETDLAVVFDAMVKDVPLETIKQYLVLQAKEHPTASDTNKQRLSKNVKATKSYVELLNLLRNTRNKFYAVKAENK